MTTPETPQTSEPSDEAVERFAVIAAQACRELAVKDAELAAAAEAVA